MEYLRSVFNDLSGLKEIIDILHIKYIYVGACEKKH